MNNLKAEGNTFFNNKEYVKALESYKNGLDECEKEIDKLKELDKLKEKYDKLKNKSKTKSKSKRGRYPSDS